MLLISHVQYVISICADSDNAFHIDLKLTSSKVQRSFLRYELQYHIGRYFN